MSKYEFEMKEFEMRQQRVREAMDQEGLDLILAIAPQSIHWLIGTRAKSFQEFQCLFFTREPGPLTMLMRLVFLLYAEDRELLPIHLGLYQEQYSASGLADQLQQDKVLYASAMDRRFGAWARLL